QQAERRGQQHALLQRLLGARARGPASFRAVSRQPGARRRRTPAACAACSGCWHRGSLRRRRAEASLARELAEALAASFEVAELVEARAGRREQHHLTWARSLPAGVHRAIELAAAQNGRAHAPPQAAVVLAHLKAAAAGEGHLSHAGQQREDVRWRDREVLLALAREQLELGCQIRLHRLVAVEVIGRHIEQYPDLGRETARVLQLKGGDLAG